MARGVPRVARRCIACGEGYRAVPEVDSLRNALCGPCIERLGREAPPPRRPPPLVRAMWYAQQAGVLEAQLARVRRALRASEGGLDRDAAGH
jgi:hypothetical protein